MLKSDGLKRPAASIASTYLRCCPGFDLSEIDAIVLGHPGTMGQPLRIGS